MFTWKEEYSCNIKSIDDQHKELLKIGSSLYEMVRLKKHEDNYDELVQILNELKDYTLYHFQAEEKLMEEYGYEELFLHKFEHKSFLKKLEGLELDELDEKQFDMTMDLIVFVANWIEQHILKSDLKYKEFFNSKGIS
ncbi:bacteriohemerythrin [Anaeromicrobium sediminis]|uniref:Bacteriohemerythrin n=1 Tax=Anaeromicrobium sediminis TaxID=1478221 RepID=A0A267MI00_9FIRM|nr:bacteriohemerythrin [Anaeromicrobium sediminis]PAB58423.1 bacteriohemerythrin [Anaeromicrobium sediminis]